jgi:hypothetical protein
VATVVPSLRTALRRRYRGSNEAHPTSNDLRPHQQGYEAAERERSQAKRNWGDCITVMPTDGPAFSHRADSAWGRTSLLGHRRNEPQAFPLGRRDLLGLEQTCAGSRLRCARRPWRSILRKARTGQGRAMTDLLLQRSEGAWWIADCRSGASRSSALRRPARHECGQSISPSMTRSGARVRGDARSRHGSGRLD